MIEIALSGLIGLCFLVALVFIRRYESLRRKGVDKGIWVNTYIFDTLPSVFPTLGIFCTALGITLGLWNFDTRDIQSSIPGLLAGLRLAFVATMLGIAGLLVFSKYTEIVRHRLDLHTGLSGLSPEQEIFGRIHQELAAMNARSVLNVGQDLAFRDRMLGSMEVLVRGLNENILSPDNNPKEFQKQLIALVAGMSQAINGPVFQLQTGIKSSLDQLAETNRVSTERSDAQRAAENALIARRFEEFGVQLQKNNTESLVRVMEGVVAQFNKQMNDLIGGLVDQNFAQLRSSIDTLSSWQRENKEQVATLTDHFRSTTETHRVSSEILRTTAEAVRVLAAEGGQLAEILRALKAVMVDDRNLRELGGSLSRTVEVLERTTDKFDSTTAKLNDWVATERNFKESAEVLISKLEEFRDLNGDVWDKYRAEMRSAVEIVQTTSQSLKADLEGVSDTFYDQLNNTLAGLDQCIQRLVKAGTTAR